VEKNKLQIEGKKSRLTPPFQKKKNKPWVWGPCDKGGQKELWGVATTQKPTKNVALWGSKRGGKRIRRGGGGGGTGELCIKGSKKKPKKQSEFFWEKARESNKGNLAAGIDSTSSRQNFSVHKKGKRKPFLAQEAKTKIFMAKKQKTFFVHRNRGGRGGVKFFFF